MHFKLTKLCLTTELLVCKSDWTSSIMPTRLQQPTQTAFFTFGERTTLLTASSGNPNKQVSQAQERSFLHNGGPQVRLVTF